MICLLDLENCSERGTRKSHPIFDSKKRLLQKSYLLVEGGRVAGWWPVTHLEQTVGRCFSNQLPLCAVTSVSQ